MAYSYFSMRTMGSKIRTTETKPKLAGSHKKVYKLKISNQPYFIQSSIHEN